MFLKYICTILWELNPYIYTGICSPKLVSNNMCKTYCSFSLRPPRHSRGLPTKSNAKLYDCYIIIIVYHHHRTNSPVT